jgi:hypothetical protein
VLPEPEGYSVKWPDLDSLGDKDKAGIALSKTQALSQYVAGGVEAVIPPHDYLTRVMGWTEEEAQSTLENAEEHQTEMQANLPAPNPKATADAPSNTESKPKPAQPKQPPPPQGSSKPPPAQKQPAQPKQPPQPKQPKAPAVEEDEDGATENYNPDQARDEHGRWASQGGAQLGRTAKAAWSSEDRDTLESIRSYIGKVGKSRARRGEFGLEGMRQMARELGVKGHSGLKKAGLAQAIQDKLVQKSSSEASYKDRVDRIELAEKHTGIKFVDRVVNGVIQRSGTSESKRYSDAQKDVYANGANAKAGNVSYLKTVRENTLRDLKHDEVDPSLLGKVLKQVHEDGYGRLSHSELLERIHGFGHQPRHEGLLPDASDIRLRQPTRGTLYKKRPRKEEEQDYTYRLLKEPAKERLANVKQQERATGTPFVTRVVNNIVKDNRIDLPSREVYRERSDRLGRGEHLTPAEQHGMRTFREEVVRRVKNGDVDDRHLVDALEAADTQGYGTMHLKEFVAAISKRKTA